MSDSPTECPTECPTGRLARPTPPRVVLRALDVVKGLVLGAVVSIGLASHVQAEPAAPPAAASPLDTQLARLMTDHRCSPTGFADGSIPAASLIRTPAGELRVVSFARGWAAHEGVSPGELVAVCLGARGELR